MQNGSTALILAAQMGHTDLVTQLLARGADINATPEVSFALFLECVCVCVYLYMYMYAYVCICVFVCADNI